MLRPAVPQDLHCLSIIRSLHREHYPPTGIALRRGAQGFAHEDFREYNHVKPLIAPILDDRFIIVEREPPP